MADDVNGVTGQAALPEDGSLKDKLVDEGSPALTEQTPTSEDGGNSLESSADTTDDFIAELIGKPQDLPTPTKKQKKDVGDDIAELRAKVESQQDYIRKLMSEKDKLASTVRQDNYGELGGALSPYNDAMNQPTDRVYQEIDTIKRQNQQLYATIESERQAKQAREFFERAASFHPILDTPMGKAQLSIIAWQRQGNPQFANMTDEEIFTDAINDIDESMSMIVKDPKRLGVAKNTHKVIQSYLDKVRQGNRGATTPSKAPATLKAGATGAKPPTSKDGKVSMLNPKEREAWVQEKLNSLKGGR